MVLVYLQLCIFCFEGFSFHLCALDRMCYYIVALPVPPLYLFIYHLSYFVGVVQQLDFLFRLLLAK